MYVVCIVWILLHTLFLFYVDTHKTSARMFDVSIPIDVLILFLKDIVFPRQEVKATLL